MYRMILFCDKYSVIRYGFVPECLVHLFELVHRDNADDIFNISEPCSINIARNFMAALGTFQQNAPAGQIRKSSNYVTIYRYTTDNDRFGYFASSLDPASFFRHVYERTPYHTLMVDIKNGVKFTSVEAIVELNNRNSVLPTFRQILALEKGNRQYPLINGIESLEGASKRHKKAPKNGKAILVEGNYYASIAEAMVKLQMSRYEINKIKRNIAL